MTAAADALVARLPRTTLVVGKGGVGKTTTAAAIALHASRRVGRTLVITTDPARALPTVLDCAVGSEATPVPWADRLDARALDAAGLRQRFMDRWSDVLRLILDRGTYLDQGDIGPLVDAALPGSDEIFAALALAELLAGQHQDTVSYERIVVDTAPTGHTLRLLQLPRTFRALVRLLDAMQGKHRTMVQALTRTYRPDQADAFLAEMTTLVTSLERTLQDPAACVAVMVTQPGTLVLEETRRYLQALGELRVAVGAIIWNASGAPAGELNGAGQLVVPPVETPVGSRGLQGWLDAMREPTAAPAAQATAKHQTAPPARVPSTALPAELLRPLTIVAGKGGVGKTTVAAALALASARTATTLIVSTDPAPSLADVFGQSIGDADTPIAEAPGGRLSARQMDATAAFARLRDEYRTRVDALFDGLVGRGVDLSHDRAIVRDLLSLAPPGIDEVYALSLLADALFEQRFERVIVDPAPTGHLLRLLEMPPLALSWTHQLMRLMLKYREVAGLGDAAADLLAFAKQLRALDALMRDPARAGVVLVTTTEPVVLAETARLADAVPARGLALRGIVRNRSGGAATLGLPSTPVQVEAPSVSPAPVGVPAIVRWVSTWSEGQGAAPHQSP